MRKALTTMMSALALAYCANAKVELVGSTNFEEENLGNILWSKSTLDESAIVNYEGSGVAKPKENIPDEFSSEKTNVKYLNVDNDNNTLVRYIYKDGDSIITNTFDKVYVDTLVQFTPYDAIPTSGDSLDKLRVWSLADAGGVTNLWISAGFLKKTTDKYTATTVNYKTSTQVDAGWHRLTILAISDITVAELESHVGFVVYVDENLVSIGPESEVPSAFSDAAEGYGGIDVKYRELAEQGALLPSMVQNGNTKNKLSSVCFQGMGYVDDLSVVTDQPKFLVSDEVEFYLVLGDGIASVTYTLNGADYVVSKDGRIAVSANDVITIKEITFSGDGYELGGVTSDSDKVVVSGDTVTITGDGIVTVSAKAAFFEYNGKKYSTLSAALEALGENSGTVALLVDYTVPNEDSYEEGVLYGVLLVEGEHNFTLDLGGNSISGQSDSWENPSVIVTGGNVTITNGTIIPSIDEGYALKCDGGKVTIRDVTIDGIVDGQPKTSIEFVSGRLKDGGIYDDGIYGEELDVAFTIPLTSIVQRNGDYIVITEGSDVPIVIAGCNFTIDTATAASIADKFSVEQESDAFKKLAVKNVLGLLDLDEGTELPIPTPTITVGDSDVVVALESDKAMTDRYDITCYLQTKASLTENWPEFDSADGSTYVANGALGSNLADKKDDKAFYRVIIVITNK